MSDGGYAIVTFGEGKWMSIEIESADYVYTEPEERVLVINGSKTQFQVNWDKIEVLAFAEDEDQANDILKALT